LTGAVRPEFQSSFRHVTGASSIRITSKVAPSEIQNLCSQLLEIYERDVYQTAFQNIQNITPINDPSILHELERILLGALRDNQTNLALTIPEILDYETAFKIAYSGAHGPRKDYDNIFIEDYREFLSLRHISDLTTQHLRHHRLDIKDENGNTKKSFPIYQCLLFDCEYNDNHYHLCDGNWYRIERNYINQLRENLDPYFSDHSVLQECDKKREDEYNESVAQVNQNYTCLDKENISPDGQTAIEPCDLYTVNDGVAHLIHIKISTRSASLSHLFNQGRNSIEILRLNNEAQNKLKNLLSPADRIPIDNANFFVTYGIITSKDKDLKSNALPIFSRISLRKAIQSLKLMGINCNVVLIKDNVSRTASSAIVSEEEDV